MQNPNYWSTGASGSKSSNQYWNKNAAPNKSSNSWYGNQQEPTNSASFLSYYPNSNDESCTEYFTYPQESTSVDSTSNAVVQSKPPSTIVSRDPRTRRHSVTPKSTNSQTSQLNTSLSNNKTGQNQSSISSSQSQLHSNTFEQKAVVNNTSSYFNTYTSTNFPPNNSYSSSNTSYITRSRTYRSPSSHFKNHSSINQKIPSYSSSDVNSSVPSYSTASPKKSQNTNSYKQSTILERKNFAPKFIPVKPKLPNSKTTQFKNHGPGSSKQIGSAKRHSQAGNKTEFAASKSKLLDSKSTDIKSSEKSDDSTSIKQRSKAKVTTESVPSLENEKSIENLINKFFTAEEKSRSSVKLKSNESKSVCEGKNYKSDKNKKDGKSSDSKPKYQNLPKTCKDLKKGSATNNEALKESLVSNVDNSKHSSSCNIKKVGSEICSSQKDKYKSGQKTFGEMLLSMDEDNSESCTSIESKICKKPRSKRKSKKVKSGRKTIEEILRAMEEGDSSCKETDVESNGLKKSPLKRKSVNQHSISNEDSPYGTSQSLFKKSDLLQADEKETFYNSLKDGSHVLNKNEQNALEIKNRKSPKKDKNQKVLQTGKSKKTLSSNKVEKFLATGKTKKCISQDPSNIFRQFSEDKRTADVDFTYKSYDGSEIKLKLTKDQLKIINMTSKLIVSVSSAEKLLAENSRSALITEQNSLKVSPRSKKRLNLSTSVIKDVNNVCYIKKVKAKKSLKRVILPSKLKKKYKQVIKECTSTSLSFETSDSEVNDNSKNESSIETLDDIDHYKIFNKADCTTVLSNIDMITDSLCKSVNFHSLDNEHASNMDIETSKLSNPNKNNSSQLEKSENLAMLSKKVDFDTVEDMDQLLQQSEENVSSLLEELNHSAVLKTKDYLNETELESSDEQKKSNTLEINKSGNLLKINSADLYKSNDSADLFKGTDSSSCFKNENLAAPDADASVILRKSENLLIVDELDTKVVFNTDEDSLILETDMKVMLNEVEDSTLCEKINSEVALSEHENSVTFDETDSKVMLNENVDSIICNKMDNAVAFTNCEDSMTFDQTDCKSEDSKELADTSETTNPQIIDDSIAQKVNLLVPDKIEMSAELDDAVIQSCINDQSYKTGLETDESTLLEQLFNELSNKTNEAIATIAKVSLTDSDIKTTTDCDSLMNERTSINTSNSVNNSIENVSKAILNESSNLNSIGNTLISNELNCISVHKQTNISEAVLNNTKVVEPVPNNGIIVPLDTVIDTKDLSLTELDHDEKQTEIRNGHFEIPASLDTDFTETSEKCDIIHQESDKDHKEESAIIPFSKIKCQKSKKSFKRLSLFNNEQKAKKSFSSSFQSENRDKSLLEEHEGKFDSTYKRKFEESVPKLSTSEFVCGKDSSDGNVDKIQKASIHKAVKSFKPLSLLVDKPFKNNFSLKGTSMENTSYHRKNSNSVAKKSCIKASTTPALLPNRNRAQKSCVSLSRVSEEACSTAITKCGSVDKERTTAKELDSNKTNSETLDAIMDVDPSFQNSDNVTNQDSEPEIIFETTGINQGSDSDMEDMEEKSLSRSNSPIKEMVLFKSSCICTAQSVSTNSFDDIFQDKCQGKDSIDGEVIPCTKSVSEHDLLSPSANLPFLKYCGVHTWRLKNHQCCPECGIFCTQGTYIACMSQLPNDVKNHLHLFHKDCFNILDAGLPPGCPHCSRFSDFKVVSLEDKSNDLSTGTNIDLSADVTNITSELEGSCILLKELNIVDTQTVTPDHPYLYVPPKKEVQSMIMTLAKEKALQLRASGKCLYVPVKVGDAEKVLQMIAIGVNPNQRFEMHNNNTPLHVACSHDFADIAHILIQAGALVDAVNNDLYTPLMVAVNKGSIRIIKHLIRVGANTIAKGEDGMTCFHLATRSGIVKIAQILYETGSVDINAQDEGGWTPIVWACEHNREEMVTWLLEIGADANVRDNEENVALHWAAYCGDEKIVEALLDNGCNLNVVNKLGDSPIHIAARKDHYKCVKMLAYRGTLLEKTNKESLTPLMCCPDSATRSYKTLNSLRTMSLNKLKNLISDQNIVIRDISRGKEIYPVQVINEIDQEEFIMDFRYILRNCTSSLININILVDNMQMCFCQDNCSSSRCICSTNSKCWYDVGGHLILDFNMYDPPPIFECNKTCHCPKTCINRVVQHGLRYPLQIFRTFSKGWGVRTLKAIRKGSFVCEYVGEIISNAVANHRKNDTYLFDLGSNDDSFCLDTHFYGNVSRFLNHSCEPNLIALKVYVEHQDLNFPRIAFFAINDIGPCEELCFDYGINFWVVKCRHLLCTCGSSFCQYSKDSIDSTLEQYDTLRKVSS